MCITVRVNLYNPFFCSSFRADLCFSHNLKTLEVIYDVYKKTQFVKNRGNQPSFPSKGYPAQALNYLFLGCFLLPGNCLTFTFTGTAIGTGTLTTNWQTFTMTETTVAGD